MYVIKVKGNPLKKGIDTMKKLTKREMFAKILTHLTDEEEINFINHQIELLDNKANGVKKPTKTQVENEELKIVIFDFLKTVDSASIVDIQKGANLNAVSIAVRKNFFKISKSYTGIKNILNYKDITTFGIYV